MEIDFCQDSWLPAETNTIPAIWFRAAALPLINARFQQLSDTIHLFEDVLMVQDLPEKWEVNPPGVTDSELRFLRSCDSQNENYRQDYALAAALISGFTV